MFLHVGIAGPFATRDVAALLDDPSAGLPPGYEGAPLLATLARRFLARGHRVTAFTLSAGMPLRRDARVVARGPRFELHYCPCRPRAWPFNGRLPGRIVDLYAFERRGLQAAMEEARPDVVHAHWSYEFAWAALRSRLPSVVTCHDSPVRIARFERDLRHGGYRWLRAGMAWHVLRQARHVTTVSPYMQAEVQPLCRAPLAVVPNPIDERAFGAGRAPLSATPRVIMVCNGWGPRKNGAAGLRAFASLARRRPAAALHFFGHGSEEGGPAQRWCEGEGLQAGVRFRGAVSHDEVLAEMAASDVMLHPALEESFGAVLAEAMAMGLPVVAGRDSGAVPWLVGDAGVLVDVREPEAMAQALHAMLDDPAAMAEFGRRGRARVRERFSVDAVAALYEAQYAAAIAAAPAPPRARLEDPSW